MDIEKAYINEISNTPLLKVEEERELAVKIQQGDLDAREQLITANLRLVVKIAHDYKNFGMPIMDLIAEGNIGLMKAADKFDPNKGAKFSSYAAWWIKQGIRKSLTDQSKTIRLPAHLVVKIRLIKKTSKQLAEELGRTPSHQELADKLKVKVGMLTHWLEVASVPTYIDAEVYEDTNATFSEIIADEKAKTPFEKLNEKHIRQDVVNLIERLDQREKGILIHRYGLNGLGPKTLEHVGSQYSLTRERVRQIQAAAVKKLGEMMQEDLPEVHVKT